MNETGSTGIDFSKILTFKISPTWSLWLVSIFRWHGFQVGHSSAAKPVFACDPQCIVWWWIPRFWCMCVWRGGVISLNISIVSFQTRKTALPYCDNCQISIKEGICVQWLKQPQNNNGKTSPSFLYLLQIMKPFTLMFFVSLILNSRFCLLAFWFWNKHNINCCHELTQQIIL